MGRSRGSRSSQNDKLTGQKYNSTGFGVCETGIEITDLRAAVSSLHCSLCEKKMRVNIFENFLIQDNKKKFIRFYPSLFLVGCG